MNDDDDLIDFAADEWAFDPLPDSKEALRDELARLAAEFEANGGQVQHLAPDATGLDGAAVPNFTINHGKNKNGWRK